MQEIFHYSKKSNQVPLKEKNENCFLREKKSQANFLGELFGIILDSKNASKKLKLKNRNILK